LGPQGLAIFLILQRCHGDFQIVKQCLLKKRQFCSGLVATPAGQPGAILPRILRPVRSQFVVSFVVQPWARTREFPRTIRRLFNVTVERLAVHRREMNARPSL
jgi:hypothetical protein